jgi:hypothetical protein
MDSVVDAVTDRVIDKIRHMDLVKELIAASPSGPAVVRSAAGDQRIPLIDLKRNWVILITLTAKRPAPGAKMNLFSGTIHLNTNHIPLSKDVDEFLADMRAKSARKAAPASADELSAETTDKDGGGDDSHFLSNTSGSEHEDEDSGAEKGASQQTSSSGVTSGSGSSGGDHALDAENSGSGGEDQTPKSQRHLSQRGDSRGRKIGSTINCKRQESLEIRLSDRVQSLRDVISSNGFDFSDRQILDQTEIARVAYGMDVIVLQRVMVFRRDKIDRFLM